MTKKQTTDVDPVDEIKSTLSFIAWFVIGILLGVVIIGIAGYIALDDKTDAIIDARTESRITACDSDRQFQTDHNALAEAGGDLPRAVFGDTSTRLSPEKAAETKAYGEAQAKRFDATIVPVRKCDKRSIESYYKSGGQLGCEVSQTNPDGRCKK